MSFQMLNYWNPKQSHSKLDIKVSIIGFFAVFFLFVSSWISHHQFATGNGIAIHISTIDMMKFIKQKCMVSHCKPFCVLLLFFRIDSNPHILGLSSYFCHINQWKVCMLLVFPLQISIHRWTNRMHHPHIPIKSTRFILGFN